MYFHDQYNSTFAKAEDWTQYGLRPLGMGNAYVAVADDFNAVFYNPAGLARLNDWYLEIINPGVTFSAGALDFFNELATNSEGEEGIVDIIEDHAGESFTLEALASPYFVMKHFGLAIGVEARLQYSYSPRCICKTLKEELKLESLFL